MIGVNMKKHLLVLSALIAMASFSNHAAEPTLLKNMFSGTEFSFAKRVDLAQGQQTLSVGKCRLFFGKKTQGKQHIEEGRSLTVSRVEVANARVGQNPMTGADIQINESVTIKFRKTKAKVVCRGQGAHEISINEFMNEGVFNVSYNEESRPFQF